MSVSAAGSFADRVARQLGLDSAGVAGSGPDGAATLADVLREAGRRPPSAARPPPPRTVFPTDAEAAQGVCRLEIACDARAVRETCGALAAVTAEPPEAVDIVVRLSGAAFRDSPGLAGAELVIRTPDDPDAVRPSASAGGPDRPVRAVLAIAVQSDSIRLGLGLELGAGSEEEGAAFLERLRSLCLDPRRALL